MLSLPSTRLTKRIRFMNKISILMPAKNASEFIAESIVSVARSCPLDWELVIVDDRSTDATAEIVRAHQAKWPQVRLLRNAGTGKVAGLNTAFGASTGDIIGTLDADDCLLGSYWDQIVTLKNESDCFSRDAVLVDSSRNYLGILRMNRNVLDQLFEGAVRELTGLPRWTWTFTRQLAERVFPIPEDLPFEDVWFSLILKRFARSICHFRTASYCYRQHSGQTFGGVLNYSPDLIRFRSERLTQYAQKLPSLHSRLGLSEAPDLSEVSAYLDLMSSPRFTLAQTVMAPIRPGWKLKVLLFRRFPGLSTKVKRIQWIVDRWRPSVRRSGAGGSVGQRRE